MNSVSLTLGEIIAALDPVNEEAFNNLYKAIEAKAIAKIGEENWLKVWNSDNWTVKTELFFKDISL